MANQLTARRARRIAAAQADALPPAKLYDTDSPRFTRIALPAPWTRTDFGTAGPLAATYTHPDGYTITRSPNPLDRYPWRLTGPDAAPILSRIAGHFRTLADAATAHTEATT